MRRVLAPDVVVREVRESVFVEGWCGGQPVVELQMSAFHASADAIVRAAEYVRREVRERVPLQGPRDPRVQYLTWDALSDFVAEEQKLVLDEVLGWPSVRRDPMPSLGPILVVAYKRLPDGRALDSSGNRIPEHWLGLSPLWAEARALNPEIRVPRVEDR